MAHAKLSPSSADRWMGCPGSVALNLGKDDKGSSYASEGTAAHELAEKILRGADGAALVGQTAENGVAFTDDMLRDVLKYTDQVHQLVESTGGTLLVEQRLPISGLTDEADAHGTSDAVILTEDELIVADLKFGMGVQVSAEENPQLMIYALAAYSEFTIVHDFKTVRLVISQPRIGNFSEWTISVEDLLAFGESVKAAAAATRQPDAPLNPSEKACKFCRAKATCPALSKSVQEITGAMFDDQTEPTAPAALDADQIGKKLQMAKLVEDWCKAIRAEAERRLLAGDPVAGYKLVQGKQGNRKWTDATEAEALMKQMKLKVDEMYDLSLISPTTAEKLVAQKAIGPRQWQKVLPLITRSPGQPSVAPESDKRPALVAVAQSDDFDAVPAAEDFV